MASPSTTSLALVHTHWCPVNCRLAGTCGLDERLEALREGGSRGDFRSADLRAQRLWVAPEHQLIRCPRLLSVLFVPGLLVASGQGVMGGKLDYLRLWLK